MGSHAGQQKHAIGIDLGGTNIKGAVVSEDGAILAEGSRKTLVNEGPKAVIGRMGDLINELKSKKNLHVVGAGVGAPGPLSVSLGVIHSSPNLPHWIEVPIRDWLQHQTGLPVALDNDANCAALGEWRFGVARGCKHMVMLTFGTGIGGGVIVDGKLLHGANDGAAELGHFIIDKNGPLCACGNRGCFEAHCAANHVARRAHEGLAAHPESLLSKASSVSAEAVSHAAERGDAYALSVLDAVSADMALGISGLVNIFNPEMVVLAGGLMRGGKHYIHRVRERVPKTCFPALSKNLKIELSSLDDKAGVLGAASLILSA